MQQAKCAKLCQCGWLKTHKNCILMLGVCRTAYDCVADQKPRTWWLYIYLRKLTQLAYAN